MSTPTAPARPSYPGGMPPTAFQGTPVKRSADGQAKRPPANTQQLQAMAAQQARSSKPKRQRVERRMPQKIDTLVPESKVYTDMVQFEKRLDAVLLRKWLDREEVFKRPARIRRSLRIFLSNLSANQPGQLNDSDYEANDLRTDQYPQAPSWTLRIEGRLLDPVAAVAIRKNPAILKFSQLVRKLVVELDRDPALYPEGNLIEWIPTVDTTPVDGFEIKRLGDQPVNARIIIDLNHQPQRFKVLSPLAQVIGVHTETRAAILMALYQYIRANKLQRPEDRNVIMMNEPLKRVFGIDVIKFVDLPELLNMHLTVPDPVVLNYVIRTETDYFMLDKAFDIEIDLQETSGIHPPETFTEKEQKELAEIEQKISEKLQLIQQSKIKREFMLGFAASPVYFIQAWLDAQARDQKTIVGDSSVSLDDQRRSALFSQPWVFEAAAHYLSNISQRRTEELMQQVRQGTTNF